MIQWILDDYLDALQPEVSTLAQSTNGATQRSPHWLKDLMMQLWDITNGKTTMQIGR